MHPSSVEVSNVTTKVRSVDRMRLDPLKVVQLPFGCLPARRKRLRSVWSIWLCTIALSFSNLAQAQDKVELPSWVEAQGDRSTLVLDKPPGSATHEPAVWDTVPSVPPTVPDIAPSILLEPEQEREASIGAQSGNYSYAAQPWPAWLDSNFAGYDRGFVIASGPNVGVSRSEAPFLLRLNGWGQLRETRFESQNDHPDLNQFQLIRGRLTFSGSAFTPDFRYFVQLDGRSSAGDEFRLLDYFMEFDIGRKWLDLARGRFVFKTGRYKVPFSFSRYLSARDFQFADRSMASMFFDLNRSMAWGLEGETEVLGMPCEWETSVFNGLVTGGAETGSSGSLDNNLAYSARVFLYPTGDWGTGAMSDFDWHESLATRVGAGYATTVIGRLGSTEFNQIRVVDSGERLGNLLPPEVDEYNVNTFCVDASCKFHGWSWTSEYYFRNISGFQGGSIPDLFDHGFWMQAGKFIIPGKFELLSRWSRVVGRSGTLGVEQESSDEFAGGGVWYFRQQNAKLTIDASYFNGAPISSSALDVSPGTTGWLMRTQIQFAF